MVAALVVALGSASAVAVAPGPGLNATKAMQPGQWLVRERGAKTGGRNLCLRDVSSLVQLRHSGAQCSRFVIDDQSNRATVHYTCPGAGHGRTTITVETSHSMTVETQGIAEGLPFQDEYSVRRAGACRPGGGR
jgi:hypothetical protein